MPDFLSFVQGMQLLLLPVSLLAQQAHSEKKKGLLQKERIESKFLPFRIDPFQKECQMVLTELAFLDVINIGIKHIFSCINIRQVSWEVLKTEAEGRGFQTPPKGPGEC